jgi:predicted PurR-regulated permease PerM
LPEDRRFSTVLDLEDKTFLLLLAAVSVAFAWVLWPFSGAILWATVLAVLFSPVYRRLLDNAPRMENVAALATLAIIVVIVLLPLTIIVGMVTREATALVRSVETGEIELDFDFQWLWDMLPAWLTDLVDRIGLPDLATLRERLSALLMESGRFLAGQALVIGQGTFKLIVSVFVMLYLLFFLLRDGRHLVARIDRAIPLHEEQRHQLFDRFAVAIRAIVKGSIVVALAQGALGGLIFWLLGLGAPVLWGAVMGVLALLPVLGTGLVWGPVALYLLMTGSIWQGIVMLGFGILVIGLADNVLRPLLIGQDTKIPDYVVLISTLGGISIFGANGLVIGPVIAAMFVAVWAVFPETRRREADGP